MCKKLLVFNGMLFLIISLFFVPTGINAQTKGVEGKDGKWGLQDANGKMITPYLYQRIGTDGNFSEGLASVTLNKKTGYIDTTGKIIIPLKYEECNSFKSGTAVVWLGENCGLIDKSGKLLIPIKYSSIDETWDEEVKQISIYNKVTETPKFGLMARNGKALLPVAYDEIGEIINGAAVVKQSKLLGYFIIAGKKIIPAKYDKAKNFNQGFAAVAINKKWGFVDANGKIALPLEYDYVSELESGYTEVRKNGVSSILVKKLIANKADSIKQFELVATTLKQLPVPSVEADVVPGLFTMKVPAYLKQQTGDLYGNISIYSDGRTFLYFKKDDNKKAIHNVDAMLQYKKWKTSVGFKEFGTIKYTGTSKISFVGFYGFMPDPLDATEQNEEAYVFFNKPGEYRETWILYYRVGNKKSVQIELDIESFLETMKLK